MTSVYLKVNTYVLLKICLVVWKKLEKNGLHTFKNNSRFFGFSVNKPAACNIVIKQLPTSILKDFSGNKHDAYLYGFKGKLNSGVGIYAQDFKNWGYGSTINTDISTKSYNKSYFCTDKQTTEGSRNGIMIYYVGDDTWTDALGRYIH